MPKKLTRKDKQELYGRLSKYFEDISKLIFAGVVLASVMKEDISVWWLAGSGSVAVMATGYFAYRAYDSSGLKLMYDIVHRRGLLAYRQNPFLDFYESRRTLITSILS